MAILQRLVSIKRQELIRDIWRLDMECRLMLQSRDMLSRDPLQHQDLYTERTTEACTCMRHDTAPTRAERVRPAAIRGEQKEKGVEFFD